MQDSRGGGNTAPDLDQPDQSVQEGAEADGAGDSLVRRFGVFLWQGSFDGISGLPPPLNCTGPPTPCAPRIGSPAVALRA